MSKPQLSSKQLRQMTKREIATYYGISIFRAETVKNASKPDYFPVLTDQKKSIAQMESETGLKRETVWSYRSALIKTGHVKKMNLENERILSFVRGNPSKYEEISRDLKKSREHIAKIIRGLRKGGRVKTQKIALGRRGVSRSLYPSLGIETDTMFAYLPGEEKLFGKKLTTYIPEELDRYTKRSLSERLKKSIHQDAFEVVHEHIFGRV